MFFDDTKETMISIEMKDGLDDLQRFKKEQQNLSKKLRELVRASGVEDNFEVHDDTIASNVKNKRANKGNSAAEVLKWLSQKNIEPEEFFAFGDSESDIGMAEEINSKNFKVQFVFVGKPDDLRDVRVSFPVIQTKELYDRGTLEFLQNYS